MKSRALLPVAAAVAMTVACGGSGGSSSPNPSPSQNPCVTASLETGEDAVVPDAGVEALRILKREQATTRVDTTSRWRVL